jgi:hypothetical protein
MQPQNIQVYLQLSKIILEYIYDVNFILLLLLLFLFLFSFKLPSLFETFPSSGQDALPTLKQTSNQQQNHLKSSIQSFSFL